jgi:hypothetical protein
MNIAPSDYRGKTLSGVAVTDNSFMGVMPFDALCYIGLHRPSQIEKANKNDLKDHKLRIAHEVRSQVQRRFDSARLKRADAYASYLEQLYAGTRTGGFPPITLFCPDLGEITSDGTKLVLPYNAALVNLDGETQTEARFILGDRDVGSGGLPVPFILYHGISQEHASAIMHDVNFYAKPVAERKIAILNSNGYMSRVIMEALAEANIDGEKISRLGNVPNKKQIVAFSGLIAGAAGALVGYSITNNLPHFITQLNNFVNGRQAEKARPFLRLALASVSEIGRFKPVIWALAGGHYYAAQKFLSPTEWEALAEAYNEARFERGTPNQAELKRKAAFEKIGIKI